MKTRRFIKGFMIGGMLAIALMSSGFSAFGLSDYLLSAPVARAQEDQDGPSDAQDYDPGSFEESIAMIPAQQPEAAKNSEDLIKQVAGMANKVHRLFAPLINVFAFHIGNFLGADYIYQGPMGAMLQNIWVISRNFVNIAFVFLLLWMALKEIFFIDQENDLKKNLIKFVLLLVAVNFSWLGTKIVLDASNVVTHAVFAIPSGIGSDVPFSTQCEVNTNPIKPIKGSCYPTAIIAPADSGTNNILYFEDREGEDDNCAKVKKAYGSSEDAPADAAYNKDGSRNPNASEANKKFQGYTSICVENLNLLNYDQNTAVIYLTYGMARIQNLVNGTGSQKVDDLAVSVLLSLAIQIAYTVALLALFIAMVVRMAMLWIFVGFSPFLILILWRGFDDQEFGEFKFGLQSFVKWAFVPAKVGAVFVVSFIMISAGQSMGEIKTALIEKSGFVFSIPEISTLFAGIGSLQSFIWLLMSLVVLWIGTFAVLEDMPIVKAVAGRINEYGKSVAKLVGTSPYWAPVLPLGKGGGSASIESLTKGVDLRKMLEEKYKGYSGADTIQKLDREAGRVDFREITARLDRGIHSVGDANWVASKYGFSNVKDMMKLDSKTLEAAFKKSQHYDSTGNRSGELYEALKKFENETSVERAEQLRDATKTGTQAGISGANLPPGTVKPPSPPATPQTPASP